MSADRTGACPNCYAERFNKPLAEVTIEDLNKWEDGNNYDLREYYDIYPNEGKLEVHIDVNCRTCFWEVTSSHYEPYV